MKTKHLLALAAKPAISGSAFAKKRIKALLALFLFVMGTSLSWAQLQSFEIDLEQETPVLPAGVEATDDGAHGPCYNGGHGWANYVFKFTATESVKITMQKCGYGAENGIVACVKDAIGGNVLGELDTQSNSCEGEVSWTYVYDGTPKDLYVHCGAYCHNVKVDFLGYLTSGTYYIRNVESGKYVAWGAAWGTRSVLTEHGAAANVTLNNGAYTISLGCKNATTALRPTDGFADQSGTWEIAPVGDGTYTIKGSNGYYRYDGSSLPAVNGAETDNGIYWEILSPAELTARMSAATISNPVDATHFIKSPDFLAQDVNITSGNAWNNIKNWGGNAQPKFTGDTGSGNTLVNNTNAEAWNMEAIDVNQNLTGLPKGTYALSAYGFYRAGSAAGAADAHANGTEELKALLYAGEASVPFMSIAEAAGKIGNVGTNTSAGYIPNSNIDAAKYFEAGNYLNTLLFSVGESGEVQIGMKKTSKIDGDWVIFDNFGLKYFGDVTIAEVELVEYVNAYNEAMDAAVAAKVLDMKDDAKTALNNAITDNTIDLSNTTAEALIAATNALKQAAEDAKDANKLYLMTIPGTDVTNLVLVNPNFDGNISGWTDTFTGKLNHGFQNNSAYGPINQFMECWAGQWSGATAPYVLPNGKLYQTVDLPAGEYTLSADVIATQQQVGQDGYIASLDDVTGIYVYAQSDVLFKSDACNATGAAPQRYEFTFNTTGGPTELGLLIENTNCNWAVMDNVKLVYNGESTVNVIQEALKEAVAGAADLSGVDANDAVKQAYADAVSAASTAAQNNGKSDEYYQTALNNMNSTKAAVENSANVYKEIVKINEKAAQLKGTEAIGLYAQVLATYTDKTATEVAPFEAAYNAAKAVATGGYQIEGIDNSWVGQSGTVPEWACPDMPGAPERFAGAPFEGDVMTKTITGLKPGTYTIVLRGGASTTGARDGFEVLTGQNRAYLFANDALYSMEVYDRTSIAAGTVETATLTCGVKEDGVLKMGIQNKTKGANWFVVNLISVTFDSSELPTTDVELAVSDAKYATFMAPFDAQLPTGVKAYTIDGVGGENELVITEQGAIAANTPVLLFSETAVTETLIGVSMAEAATYTSGLLTGVYAPVEITGGYVLQNGVNGVAFYRVDSSDPITVPANRAYLDGVNSEAKAFFFPESEATAIEGINALANGNVEAIYNAAGAKQNGLQKGINIIKMANGKTVKVLVK